MQRRHTLAALAAVPGVFMTSLSEAAPLLQALKPSPRLPVLFMGHGSPMNAIEDTPWRRGWQSLGTELLAHTGAQPQLILCISAHWLTRGGWQITGMAKPKTIHDFGGFPQALFEQQYPAPGAPTIATRLAQELKSPVTGAPLGVDVDGWGLDHGTWSVLKPMFPQASIPVLQLSMDYSRPPSEHYALGQQLRSLRDRGVLIVGSGNIVHNLRAVRRDASVMQAYDWAQGFDAMVQVQIETSNLGSLTNFQALGHMAQMAHPTHEHYLPLLYATGAVHAGEAPRFMNTGFQAASISMRSVVWG